MKEYLVVGGHGFIGSHFCSRLNPEDYDVYDLDNPNGDPPEAWLKERKKGLNPSVADIYDNHSYKYLIYFASWAGIRSKRDSLDYFENNCLKFAEVVRKCNFSKLVYISSSSVLGDVETAYSLSKKIAEEFSKTQKYHLIIRPFTVYGKYGRPEMFITKCINQKHIVVNGDPSNIKRKFTYVEDLVDCVFSNLDKQGTINAIGEHKYSLKDIMNIFGNTYECQEASPFDFNSQTFDEADNFICQTKLEDVKDDLIASYKELSA